MKLLVQVELVYNFDDATQVVASIEASHTNDQIVLSEALDVQPAMQLLRDKTQGGDRRIRACMTGEVAIRYSASVENKVRQLLPETGRQHLWSELPHEVLPFLLPSRFCPSDKFMRFAQREFSNSGDGVARTMSILNWISRHVDYVSGVNDRGAHLCGSSRCMPGFRASRDYFVTRVGNSGSRRERLRPRPEPAGLPCGIRGLSGKQMVAGRSDKASSHRGHCQNRQRQGCIGHRIFDVRQDVPNGKPERQRVSRLRPR